MGKLISFLVAMTLAFLPLHLTTKADELTVARIERARSVQCLAYNMYFEARNQSVKGMQAVGWVTMNRAKSPDFQNDVCGVVYDKNGRGCQFSWTCAKGHTKKIREIDTWTKVVALAEKVYDNVVRDPTHGALYFHHIELSPQWANSKRVVARIGDHVFYR